MYTKSKLNVEKVYRNKLHPWRATVYPVHQSQVNVEKVYRIKLHPRFAMVYPVHQTAAQPRKGVQNRDIKEASMPLQRHLEEKSLPLR